MKKEEKFYYEVHVYGRNGLSTSIVSDFELDEDERINLAVKQGRIDSEDVEYVDYTGELSFDEWDEHFNFDKDLLKKQIELQEEMQSKGLNLVTCGNCGTTIIHKTHSEEISCHGCGFKSEPCDFPDLFYMPSINR